MRIVIVRHADAVPAHPAGDPARPLTPHGHAQAHALAAALGRRKWGEIVVATSPFVRAKETAEILAAKLTPGKPPAEVGLLAAGELRPRKLSEAAEAFAADTVFLVGHMPDVAAYAGWLLDSPAGAVEFDKCAAACVVFGGAVVKGEGLLEWLLPPAWVPAAG